MPPNGKTKMSEIDAKIEKYIQEHSCCVICGGCPCDWSNFASYVIEAMTKCKAKGKTNKEIRFAGYKRFIKEKYGIVGKGVRIPCPDCVKDEIRKLYPENNDNDYTGFHLCTM